MTNKVMIKAISMGNKYLKVLSKGIFEILDATNKFIPIGGVICPKVKLILAMIPKCRGSTPRCWTIGRKIGCRIFFRVPPC